MVAQNSNRSKLLQGTACAALAAALLLPVQKASAQAFQATGTVVDGSATIDRSVGGQDTITAQTDTVVIDWSPTEDQAGDALTFLPQGNTAIFQDTPGFGGFAVLNRILPSTNGNVVVMDGTVITRLQDASGGFSTGGAVAFYSPTGLLIGSNAVFDVGSLLLTTLAPDTQSFTEFATGGGALNLVGTQGQTSGVTIQPGAQIMASGEGSFFAVAAPMIDMGGTATINGSTAYVAGEQVNMSFSNGLFDIVVPVGTSVANAVTHTGSTGGPASTGTGDNHVIYVVAKPNQTPIQMLLNGNLGFAPAQTAGMDNGDIILSAGRDVSGRTVDLASGTGQADIVVDNAQLTSSLVADATNNLFVTSIQGNVSIAGDVFLRADKEVHVQAYNGFTTAIDGALDAAARVSFGSGGTNGGFAAVEAFTGSSITISGDVTLDDGSVILDGQANGGTASIFTDGGSIAIGGSATVDAAVDTIQVSANFNPTGVAGGTAQIGAINGGTVEISGDATIDGSGVSPATDRTLQAYGGTAQIFSGQGSTVHVGGDTSLQADAFAGIASDPSTIEVGGFASGGYAEVAAFEDGNVQLDGDVSVSADGQGGNGQGGGDAYGGFAGVIALAGTIAVGGNIDASASAFGGNSDVGVGGDGGSAFGGQVYVQANGDLTATASVTAGDVALRNSGYGGDGGAGDGTTAAGDGGSGSGGLYNGETGGAFVLAGVDNGTLNLGNIVATSNGFGGHGGLGAPGQAGGSGGDGNGGTTQLGTFLADGDGSVGLGSATFGDVLAKSDGIGGNGGSGGTSADPTGDGGAGAGGATFLTARLNSQVTAGAVVQSASGYGGGGNSGGAALGGTLSVESASAQVDLVQFTGSANASGGNGSATAGAATAGEATITVDGGSFTTTGLTKISANGEAGDASGVGAAAADGTGGTTELLASNGASVELQSVQASAGGRGSDGTAAGTGTGGSVRISAEGPDTVFSILANVALGTGDQFDFNSTASAMGLGGDLAAGGSGNGGDGIGGDLVVSAVNGAGLTFGSTGSGDYLRLYARGLGGSSAVDGTSGGQGIGGTGTVSVDNATMSMGETIFSMYSEGGSSGDANSDIAGGDATGGTRSIGVENGGTLNASLVGGVTGGLGGNGSGTGAGGDATGGIASLVVDNATANLTGNNSIVTGPTGGNGATGGSATGGQAIAIVSNGGAINMLPDGDGNASLVVSTFSHGGTGATGAGGSAEGGDASVRILDSSFGGGSIYVGSDALAGDSDTTIASDALGGSATLLVANSQADLTGESVVSANASGGSGSTDATGGDARFEILGDSAITFGSVLVATDALSGVNGGTAVGGSSSMNVYDAAIAAGDNLDLTSVATADGGTGATGGTAALYVGQAPESSTGGGATLDATGINFDTSASGADINIAGGFAIAAILGDITVRNLGGSSLGTLNGGTNSFTADGGSIFITSSAEVDTTGDIDVIALDGGVVGDPNPQDPSASLYFQSQGTITTQGDNDNLISFGGAALTLASRELNIENGSRIGAQSVSLVSLDTENTAILGGDTEEAGYTLTQAEAERIEAGSVEFTAPLLEGAPSGTPDVLVRDLTVAGSQDDGPSFVGLFTDGIVRVEGILSYISAGPDDRLQIIAGEGLEVVTPGGIGVVDPEGNPTGSLSIYSDNIWVADAETIDMLGSDINFAGRNDRLSTAATGSDDPLGYLRAGRMELGVGETLFVRNSGTTDEPGGILVGEGGLSIFSVGSSSSTGSSDIDVFAYGRQQKSDGTFVTGQDFFDIVDFNFDNGEVPTSYTEDSEFNDCPITPDDCGAPPPPEQPDQPDEIPVPVNNPAVIEAPISQAADPVASSEEESDAQFGSEFPGLVDTPLVTDQTLLDDPVASGGDSSLYASAGSDDDQDDDEDDGDNDGDAREGE